MMEYYLMKQYAVSPVSPLLVEPEPYQYRLSREGFDSLPDCSLGYYQYSPETELPDTSDLHGQSGHQKSDRDV